VTLEEFLQRAVGILDETGVPYMVTGSLASAFYAVPRATQDLDFVFATDRAGVERMVQAFLDEGFYVDRDAAIDAHRTHGQFNAIDPAAGWKVDLIVRRDRPYSRVEFERRRPVSFLGVEFPIASLEDILIAKLEWGRMGDSTLQRRDVMQLLERTWSKLDRNYVERWVEELGLRSEWTRARAGLTDALEDADR
jgi:hypothetical protein